jgi:D-glycero-D-manno-heptose 1,7-bisphosphate phosphatase
MKNKAIILDRDGVLIEDTEYPHLIEEIVWKKGLRRVLKEWGDKGYLLFVASNQSGLARKYFTWEKLIVLESDMEKYLGVGQVEIKEWIYCPHLNIDEFNCSCRKPESLMLDYLTEKYDLDIQTSWFIGDSERDIVAGQKAKLNTASIGKCKDSKLINPTQRITNLIDLVL